MIGREVEWISVPSRLRTRVFREKNEVGRCDCWGVGGGIGGSVGSSVSSRNRLEALVSTAAMGDMAHQLRSGLFCGRGHTQLAAVSAAEELGPVRELRGFEVLMEPCPGGG